MAKPPNSSLTVKPFSASTSAAFGAKAQVPAIPSDIVVLTERADQLMKERSWNLSSEDSAGIHKLVEQSVKTLGLETETTAVFEACLSWNLLAEGKIQESLEVIKNAAAHLDRAAATSVIHADSALVYALEGLCHFELKKYQEALAAFEKTARVRAALKVSGEPDLINAFRAGLCQAFLNRPEDKLRTSLDAIRQAPDFQSPHRHLRLAVLACNAGDALTTLNLPEKAMEQYRLALKLTASMEIVR